MRWRRRTAALLLASGLGGCSAANSVTSFNPVDWWHGLEGGTIAETRPPPPNADAPYPNLGSVPAKPPPPDKAAQAQIAGGLVADRANAQYVATAQPLPPAAPSTTHRPPPAQSLDAEQPNATLQAANAPPAVRQAPVAPVSSAPLAAPAAPSAPAATTAAAGTVVSSAPTGASAAPAPVLPATTTVMPGIPDAPPPPPSLSGVAVPAVTAPTPPPVAPPAPPHPVVVTPGGPVAIPFPVNSADLPTDALAPLKALVQRRGNASIAVTGYGDATGTDTDMQEAALPLALARARAVAANLLAAGVPSNAVRIEAEPQGSGAAARLVN